MQNVYANVQGLNGRIFAPYLVFGKNLLCTIRHFDLERSEREKSLSNKEQDSSLFYECSE